MVTEWIWFLKYMDCLHMHRTRAKTNVLLLNQHKRVYHYKYYLHTLCFIILQFCPFMFITYYNYFFVLCRLLIVIIISHLVSTISHHKHIHSNNNISLSTTYLIRLHNTHTCYYQYVTTRWLTDFCHCSYNLYDFHFARNVIKCILQEM